MSLTEYFENVEGIGILGTADAAGKVDVALYARPHVLDENTVAFVMSDHLSHDNLSSNPHAAYLFVERGEAYNGLRMYLTRTREETDPWAWRLPRRCAPRNDRTRRCPSLRAQRSNLNRMFRRQGTERRTPPILPVAIPSRQILPISPPYVTDACC